MNLKFLISLFLILAGIPFLLFGGMYLIGGKNMLLDSLGLNNNNAVKNGKIEYNLPMNEFLQNLKNFTYNNILPNIFIEKFSSISSSANPSKDLNTINLISIMDFLNQTLHLIKETPLYITKIGIDQIKLSKQAKRIINMQRDIKIEKKIFSDVQKFKDMADTIAKLQI